MIKTLLFSAIEDMLRDLSGPLGIRLRRIYYRRRLKRCGKGLVIEPGVHLVQPDYISLGQNVWIDRNAVLIAGAPDTNAYIEQRKNEDITIAPGEIIIGSDSHIGIGAIIQGHGGVEIGDCFTASPSAKIYSFSNDYRLCRNGTIRVRQAKQYYLQTPVHIGRNVWIGMNAIIVGHSIGADCFIKPGATVAADMPVNSIVEGTPAKSTQQRFQEAKADL